jgi:hypothetical protein
MNVYDQQGVDTIQATPSHIYTQSNTIINQTSSNLQPMQSSQMPISPNQIPVGSFYIKNIYFVFNLKILFYIILYYLFVVSTNHVSCTSSRKRNISQFKPK